MQNTKSISKRGLSFDLSPPSLAYEPLPTTDSSSATLNDPSQGQERDPSSRDWKVLVALCTFSVALCYADRSNISTAMIGMASDFGWDKSFQGWVLSSFFFGYAFTQILGGQLADRYGGKYVLAAGVASWSVFTALTPEAAASGVFPLIATRILLGVGEGVAFPSIHSLISQNVPYSYQSTAVGIATAASYAGTALAFGMSPYIISQVGWPAVFHNFAAVAVVWLPLWFVFARTRPPPSTSTSSLSNETTAKRPIFDKGLLPLLRRREVLAICVAQYCGSWGLYGLLSWLPTFFSDYYKVELQDLASFTLLPYIVQGGVGALTGFVADRLISSGWSVKQTRRVLQVAGMIGPAACLLLAVSPFVGPSPSTASALITIGLGLSALTLGGVSTSHLDIAPRHAGVVFGAGNTAGTLAGFISVPFTGWILQTTDSWSLVFTIISLHYLVGAAVWFAWVGDKQLPEDCLE